MAGRKIWDEQDALECLASADRSGVSRAAWARANGVDGRSLNAWRLNLARRGSGRVAASNDGGLRLVELVPRSRPSEPRVRVRCGPFTVEVDGEVGHGSLTRILEAVASAC
jgi:transposase-like protein